VQAELKPGTSLMGSRAGAPRLGAATEFRDPVNASKWSCGEVSRDGEFVCGGAAAKDAHVVRVWEAHGAQLAIVLEGPAVGLRSVAWHADPSRCARAIVSLTILTCALAQGAS
jgi:hypothetical protein